MENSAMPVRWNIQGKQYEAYRAVAQKASAVHWHSHYLLMLYNGGQGTQVLNGVPYALSKGTVILMTPLDFHYNLTEGQGFDYYGVKFSDTVFYSRLEEFLELDKFPIVGKLNEAQYETAEFLFDRLLEEQQDPDRKGSNIFAGNLIEQLILIAFRSKSIGEKPNKNGRSMRRVLLYIQEHFREKITVESMASLMHYSPNHFSKRFREHTGMTFQNYIKDLRLDFSKHLLASGMSVTEACYESGFQSLSYFSRAYKRKYQCSPKCYLQ